MVVYKGCHLNLHSRKLITIKAHKKASRLLVSEYKYYKVKNDLTTYPTCDCWWQLELVELLRNGERKYVVKQCYICD